MGAAPRLRRVTPAAKERLPQHDEALDTAARLLAVLGHDISNQLTIALNYSFLLARGLEDSEGNPELRGYVEEMQQAAWRASHLTQLMRIAAPSRSTRPDSVDLHGAIEAAWPLLERISAPAQLKLDAPRGCARVVAVRSDVDQILCALALHARRVLAHGGAWELSVRPHSDERGNSVRLSCTLSAPPRVPDEMSSGVLPSTPPPRGDLLRAALRRSKARLSRRRNTVRIDFRVST